MEIENLSNRQLMVNTDFLPQERSEALPLHNLVPVGTAPGEIVRHILLGRPEAIRQTIHRLHSLHYAESGLWSPILSTKEPVVLTAAQGEAMSLLRKHL